MSVLSSILQHAQAGQGLKPAATLPQASATSSTSSSSASSSSGTSASSDASTISANDFLTLLVTEMQNQDPTAQTDPNEYINQLVSVNSLEQLIDINQTLTEAYPSTTSATSTSGSGAKPVLTTSNYPSSASPLAARTPQTTAGSSLSTLSPALSSHATTSTKATVKSDAAGNLTIPVASPSALRVAHALSGRSHSVHGRSPSSQASSTSDYSTR
jgi:flagellar basal-body rod modification protein FlgD